MGSAIKLQKLYSHDRDEAGCCRDICTPISCRPYSQQSKFGNNLSLNDEDLSLSLSYTHTHTHTQEYYSAMRKKEILPFATTRMDLEDILPSEISHTEKDKYSMTSLICGV